KLAGINDADLRHVKSSGDAGDGGGKYEDPQFERLDRVAEKACAALRIANGRKDAACPRVHDAAARDVRGREGACGHRKQDDTCAVGVQIEAEDVFEIREAVVSAEPHVVSEKCQHESIAERLCDDRKVHSGDS